MEGVEEQVSSIPTKWMELGRDGTPEKTEVLFPEDGEDPGVRSVSKVGSEGHDPLYVYTKDSLLVAIVLSTVQEAEIVSVVVPAEGATHCLLREIRPTELK